MLKLHFKWIKLLLLWPNCSTCALIPQKTKSREREKKTTWTSLTLRRLRAHAPPPPDDLTAKIKVWFTTSEELHYSTREHFRGNSATTDEMLQDVLPFEHLPVFGHMVKYSRSKHAPTNCETPEFAHIEARWGVVAETSGHRDILHSLQTACNFFCGSRLSASIRILWRKDDVGSWNMLCKFDGKRGKKKYIGATEHDETRFSTIKGPSKTCVW